MWRTATLDKGSEQKKDTNLALQVYQSSVPSFSEWSAWRFTHKLPSAVCFSPIKTFHPTIWPNLDVWHCVQVPHLALRLVGLGRLGRGVQVGHSSVEDRLVRRPRRHRRRLARVLGVDVRLLRDGSALLRACQLPSWAQESTYTHRGMSTHACTHTCVGTRV